MNKFIPYLKNYIYVTGNIGATVGFFISFGHNIIATDDEIGDRKNSLNTIINIHQKLALITKDTILCSCIFIASPITVPYYYYKK